MTPLGVGDVRISVHVRDVAEGGIEPLMDAIRDTLIEQGFAIPREALAPDQPHNIETDGAVIVVHNHDFPRTDTELAALFRDESCIVLVMPRTP